jgi:hypothetical protein
VHLDENVKTVLIMGYSGALYKANSALPAGTALIKIQYPQQQWNKAFAYGF